MGRPGSSGEITRRLDREIEELASRRLCQILKKGVAEEVIGGFVNNLLLGEAGFRGAASKLDRLLYQGKHNCKSSNSEEYYG